MTTESSVVKRSPSMAALEDEDFAEAEEGRSFLPGPQHASRSPPQAPKPGTSGRLFMVKWARALTTVAALYIGLLSILLILVRQLPTRGALSEKAHLPDNTELLMKLPHNIAELRAVRHTLELYRANYSMQVASLLLLTYLVLQALSIPGTLCINLLIGSMYKLPLALLAVAFISTAGACLNYELSALLLRDMVMDLWPQRLSQFHRSIQKHQDNLLSFFIVLRVTPLLPSWFLNVAAPIVQIPFRTFMVGTLIGLQPLNFITVSAGRTLGRLQNYSDLYGPRTMLTLFACALVALLPVVAKRLLSKRSQTGSRLPT